MDNGKATDPSDILKNRLIGFFDILGFSQILRERNIRDVHGVLASFLDEAHRTVFINDEVTNEETVNVTSNFAARQFAFDTLVLVSEAPDHEHADANFIFACNHIFVNAMRDGIPIRGAIGIGDVLVDYDRGMILSNQLPHIHEIEQNQHWAGIALTDEVFARVAEPLLGSNRSFSAFSPIVPWSIPFKKANQTKASYVLNWLAGTPDSVWNKTLELMISPKKENTKAFIDAITQSDGYKQAVGLGNVVEFRYASSRLKTKFLFIDKNGNPVEPDQLLTITMSDGITQPRQITFGPRHLMKPKDEK